MIATAAELAAVALALLGSGKKLTPKELKVPASRKPSAALIKSVRQEIQAGGDPLGDVFSMIRSPAERRAQGATYTPQKPAFSATKAVPTEADGSPRSARAKRVAV
jgi:hypothetical protein